MFRSSDHHSSGQPLLHTGVDPDDEERGRPTSYGGNRRASPLPRSPNHNAKPISPNPTLTTTPSRPTFSRQSTMRSRSASTGAAALALARRKYTYAAIFLVVSLISFTIQTELAAYVQRDLGWDKAYCMLYLTHGSWAFLWPAQLLILRIQKRDMPWRAFWRRHVYLLRTTGLMVERQELDLPRSVVAGTAGGKKSSSSPVPYLVRTTAFVTTALTVAGLSWYLAVNMTTPSDLTAIYNCSAFFAYAFSVPLLKERLRLDKSVAVAVAIVGVLVVAYGDTKETSSEGGGKGGKGGSGNDDGGEGSSRFLGNLIIGAGSVLYGLYEVLYKRYACPPDGTSPGRGMIFANAFGSLIGSFTLLVLWIPLPILHVLGWETFVIPTGRTALLLFISIVMNATFAGSFLVLISLTSPVLSSVAALLTIFIVGVVDWFLTGQPLSAAALFGGLLIVIAFGMLSYSTWREMAEDERKHEVDLGGDDDDNEDSDKDDD
jgi:drug/metabolite transporter (DMT)-like permease